MKGLIRWSVTVVLILLFSHSFGQLFNKKINQFDEDGKRNGLWITWWDEVKKIPMSKITFKDGLEKGIQKEYSQNGTLNAKFRYHKNRIRIKYYHTNGKLESKGWSVMDYKELHYYWHGKWKFYNENRKLIRHAQYLYGADNSKK